MAGMSPLADTKPSIALITDGRPVELTLNHIGEPPCPPPSSRALTFRWDDGLEPMPDSILLGQPEPEFECD